VAARAAKSSTERELPELAKAELLDGLEGAAPVVPELLLETETGTTAAVLLLPDTTVPAELLLLPAETTVPVLLLPAVTGAQTAEVTSSAV
jgi:hypothetical protein